MSRQQVSAELCLSFASSGDTQLHHEDVAEMNRSEPGEGRAHQLHVPKVIGASRLLSDNMVFRSALDSPCCGGTGCQVPPLCYSNSKSQSVSMPPALAKAA